MEYSLVTAENIYRAVLDGIKKESTAVLTPKQFNRLINQSALIEWMRSKAGGSDFDQHYVDALRNLYKYSPEVSIDTEGNEVTGKENVRFKLPKDYYRLQSVSFKLKEGKEWIPVKRMRSDSLSVMKVNPFRTPTDSRLYYYQEGNHVINYPENEKVQLARFFYLAKPEDIIYDPQGTSKNGNLLYEQNKEVVDIAVRIFIERVKEERYQTQLVEENLKNVKSNI